MGEYTKLFERAAARYPEPELSTEGLTRRGERKQRNQRVAAGVVGIAVFVAAVLLVTTSPFDRTQEPDRTPEPASQLEPPSRAPIAIGTGSANGWDWLLSASADGRCVSLTDSQGSHVNCVPGPSPMCQQPGANCPSGFVFDGAYHSPRPPAPSLLFVYGRVPPAIADVKLDIRATEEPTEGRVFDAPKDVAIEAQFFVEWVGGYPYPIVPEADVFAGVEGASGGISMKIERPSWAEAPRTSVIQEIASGTLPEDDVYDEEPWRIALFRTDTGQLCLGRPTGAKVCGPSDDPAWLQPGSNMKLIGGHFGGIEPYVRIFAWGIVRDPVAKVRVRSTDGYGTSELELLELPAKYGGDIKVFIWACSGPECHHGSLIGLDDDGNVIKRIE